MELFYNSASSPDGKGYRCKPCDTAASKLWRERNPEKAQRSRRGRNLRYQYGISLDEYEEMFEGQGRCCAICKTAVNSKAGHLPHLSFSVDHCHTSGAVRGILCNDCNRGIGLLKDSPEILEQASNYLKQTH